MAGRAWFTGRIESGRGEVGARRGRDQHPKIVGRLQTRLPARHASDLAKLLSEVKYALTRKQA